MAGAHIDLDVIGLERVSRVLQRLAETSHDVDPVLRDIGEHLLNSTKDRFATEAGPGGGPWEAAQAGLRRVQAEEEARTPGC